MFGNCLIGNNQVFKHAFVERCVENVRLFTCQGRASAFFADFTE
jgi:hypothetical protein